MRGFYLYIYKNLENPNQCFHHHYNQATVVPQKKGVFSYTVTIRH